jgi:hypothetical protein
MAFPQGDLKLDWFYQADFSGAFFTPTSLIPTYLGSLIYFHAFTPTHLDQLVHADKRRSTLGA